MPTTDDLQAQINALTITVNSKAPHSEVDNLTNTVTGKVDSAAVQNMVNQAVATKNATFSNYLAQVTALTTGALAQWAKLPDALITGNQTRNGAGVLTSASVLWPDGATGTFTTDTINSTLNTIDAYHITHVSGGVVTTYTQPLMTRDSVGNITVVPAIQVS